MKKLWMLLMVTLFCVAGCNFISKIPAPFDPDQNIPSPDGAGETDSASPAINQQGMALNPDVLDLLNFEIMGIPAVGILMFAVTGRYTYLTAKKGKEVLTPASHKNNQPPPPHTNESNFELNEMNAQQVFDKAWEFVQMADEFKSKMKKRRA